MRSRLTPALLALGAATMLGAGQVCAAEAVATGVKRGFLLL